MSITEIISENLFTIITIPLIAALIGWITNYIAVKMIFRPKKAFNFLGIKIQGLVPKRQTELASSMGEMIQRDLISHSDVNQVLQGEEIRTEVYQFIDTQIDSMLSDFLAKNPMLTMFIQGEMLENIKSSLSAHMTSAVPKLLNSVVGKVESNLDFKKIVEDKINSFDLTKLEDIVYRISSTELKTIEYLGAVLGFIVGLLQVAIMLFTK